MTMTKKSDARRQEAKRLRDSGLTFKAVGEAIGCGAQRASELVRRAEREARRIAAEQADPSLIPWHRGLSLQTVWVLKSRGIESRDDCMIFAANKLDVKQGRVSVPGDSQPYQLEYRKPLTMKMVNEVRAWLGVAPYVTAPRVTTAASIENAKCLLEQHGWTVTPPEQTKEIGL